MRFIKLFSALRGEKKSHISVLTADNRIALWEICIFVKKCLDKSLGWNVSSRAVAKTV